MGSNLYWSPVGKGKPIGDSTLKNAVRRRYGGNRGLDRELDYGSKDFLEGLAATNVEGASELIDAIEKHDVIRVWEAE